MMRRSGNAKATAEKPVPKRKKLKQAKVKPTTIPAVPQPSVAAEEVEAEPSQPKTVRSAFDLMTSQKVRQ